MATEQPDLVDNFIQRGESYKVGMILLINSLSEQDWKVGTLFSARLNAITEKIEALYKEFEDDLNLSGSNISFKVGNSRLESLIRSYVAILDYHTTLKDHFQALCKAERYSVWLAGREPFSTKVIVEENSRNLEITLNEEPIDDKELLRLEYLNESSLWFNSLNQWEKNVIQEFRKRHEQQEKVYSIPSSLRNFPGLANASFHECKIDNKPVLSYFRHATQLPIDLLGKKGSEDEQFRLTCINLASQIRLSLEKISTQSKSEVPNEVVILTQSLVSPGEAASFKAKYISDPSDNDTRIYETKEKAVDFFQKALADPEALIQDDKIKSLFFNKEELDQKKDSLCYKDFLEKWGLISQGNEAFEYGKQKFHKITLLSTNHPLNVLRHLGTYRPQVERNEENTALLLGAISRYLGSLIKPFPKSFGSQSKWPQESWPKLEEYIDQCHQVDNFNIKLNDLIKKLRLCEKEKKISVKHKKSIINFIKQLLTPEIKSFLDENTLQLFDALHNLLSIPSGQGVLARDERHKPQLRSTAEIMIVNCLGGIAWVACKSGKDRTGGASIAADAAAIFSDQRERLPLHGDNKPDRNGYLSKFEKLLKSGHHQKVASENAPGAQGIIKITSFSSSDLKLKKDQVLSETQLARLNKPKIKTKLQKNLFNQRILKKELQDIKNKTIHAELGTSATMYDWARNWEAYFINGKSFKALRDGKNFEDEQDLTTFIEIHLLAQIKGQELKEYYKALILYSFHQGGFLHAASKVTGELVNQYLFSKEDKAIIGQPNMQINISYSEEYKGFQIEEINTYKCKKILETGENIMPEKGGNYCQIQSCILLNLSEVKGKKGYNLDLELQNVSLDCADEFKPIFFKESNFLDAFMQYLRSLLAAIKRYFDKLIKTTPDLDGEWASNAYGKFFKEETQAEEDHLAPLDKEVSFHQ